MTATTVATVGSQTPLNALDRCDRCGAAALVRVTLKSHGELLFCGSHFNANKPELVEVAVNIHSEMTPANSYAL